MDYACHSQIGNISKREKTIIWSLNIVNKRQVLNVQSEVYHTVFLIWKITKLNLYVEKGRFFYTMGKKSMMLILSLFYQISLFLNISEPHSILLKRHFNVYLFFRLAILWLLLGLSTNHYILMQCDGKAFFQTFLSALFTFLYNYFLFFLMLKHNCKINCIQHFCKDSSCAFCRCCP